MTGRSSSLPCVYLNCIGQFSCILPQNLQFVCHQPYVCGLLSLAWIYFHFHCQLFVEFISPCTILDPIYVETDRGDDRLCVCIGILGPVPFWEPIRNVLGMLQGRIHLTPYPLSAPCNRWDRSKC